MQKLGTDQYKVTFSLISELDLIHLVSTRYKRADKMFLFILVAVNHFYSLLAHQGPKT